MDDYHYYGAVDLKSLKKNFIFIFLYVTFVLEYLFLWRINPIGKATDLKSKKPYFLFFYLFYLVNSGEIQFKTIFCNLLACTYLEDLPNW